MGSWVFKSVRNLPLDRHERQPDGSIHVRHIPGGRHISIDARALFAKRKAAADAANAIARSRARAIPLKRCTGLSRVPRRRRTRRIVNARAGPTDSDGPDPEPPPSRSRNSLRQRGCEPRGCVPARLTSRDSPDTQRPSPPAWERPRMRGPPARLKRRRPSPWFSERRQTP
jgi:hypothetical protein